MAGSRIVRAASAATISPGMPTIANTQRQLIEPSSSAAIVGPKPSPNRAKALCWKPRLLPRRRGSDASATAAKLDGQKAPSNSPIAMRHISIAANVPASPDSPDSSENSTSAGTITRRRPNTSDRLPMNSDDTPQAMPSEATRLPTSCGRSARSPTIVDERSPARSAITQRSRPTRPKPRVSSTTAFHS